MGGFFITAAIIALLAFFVFFISRSIRIRKKGIEADAAIISVDHTQESTEDGDYIDHPIYHVRYRMENGLEVEARLGDEPEGLAVGDTVRIKYLPEKPAFVLLAK